MKKQEDLYNALIEADHICDASGLDQTIADISGNICTIAEVAQQGIMNPNFAATALVVISQFAALSDEQVEDIGNVFKSIREKITCGLVRAGAAAFRRGGILMDKRLEQKVSFAVASTLAFMVAILLVCMIAEGSTHTGWVGNRYIHETKSQMYDKGEPCRNTYRWRGNKLYYFGDDGKILRSNTKYIKLNKDHSVHYIYTPGTNHNDRYNARLMRYQKRTRKGHWKEYGMQTNVWWMCDWQE